MLPKVKFQLPSIKKEAQMLRSFCHPRPTGWDWSQRIYKRHPELEEIVRGAKDKDEFLKRCNKYAKTFIKQNKKELLNSTNNFQKDWDKIGPKYFKILSQHFETDYPKNIKIIRAYVSIVPICPRFLDEWSFNVRYEKPEQMRKIAMHEIMHFLHFKKWMEIFPKTKRKELDTPYLVWKLSEILAPIILNNHPQIQKMVKTHSAGYQEFQNIKIGGKKLIPYFENLYQKHLKTNHSFEHFLKLCWGKTQQYRAIIEKI